MFEEEDATEEQYNEMQKKAQEITILYQGTFGTELGQKCIKQLEDTFVNRDIYREGATLDQVAFRQGEASVIKKIIKEINSHGRFTTSNDTE